MKSGQSFGQSSILALRCFEWATTYKDSSSKAGIFNRKASKVTKDFGSTACGEAVAKTRRQVSVKLGTRPRPLISENKPVDTVFEHDVVEIDQQFFETFEAFCSKALCIPVSRTHAQDRTGSPRWLPTRNSEEAQFLMRDWRPKETSALTPNLKPQTANSNVHPAGLEPTTFGSGGQRSIQLSYGCDRFRQ